MPCIETKLLSRTERVETTINSLTLYFLSHKSLLDIWITHCHWCWYRRFGAKKVYAAAAAQKLRADFLGPSSAWSGNTQGHQHVTSNIPFEPRMFKSRQVLFTQRSQSGSGSERRCQIWWGRFHHSAIAWYTFMMLECQRKEAPRNLSEHG